MKTDMSLKNKYICIHGHFYQPPRENPWLGYIQKQLSATPYHNWNARIADECYHSNGVARVLNDDDEIIKLNNNYSEISFNVGPTLMSWLQKYRPDTYQNILNGDLQSVKQHSGHGSALAQVYGHSIMPLLSARDKKTQILWGIEDFEYRFKRKPKGMWLSETAVDTETLETMVAQGIGYTILSPRQIDKWRKTDDNSNWNVVQNESFDTTRPYRYNLPSGKSIDLFFYDGPLSQAIAFERLLNDGRTFANRLIHSVNTKITSPQLIHVATDGESYGHHHRYGEMALASCIDTIKEIPEIQLTNYGQYLELFPPQFEAKIKENSSWSCVHGIERWRSNCGCSTGGEDHYHQEWRKPLRETLDHFRRKFDDLYENLAPRYLIDIWSARNAYIKVLLDKDQKEQFLTDHAAKELTQSERTKVWQLLELQKNALFMFTSCGWFFNEVSGIETNQILLYNVRGIDYYKALTGDNLMPTFIKWIEKIPSNKYKNAAANFSENIVPLIFSPQKLTSRFALQKIFDHEIHPQELEYHEVTFNHFEKINLDGTILYLGELDILEKNTETLYQTYFAAYLGRDDIHMGIIQDDVNSSPCFQTLKTTLLKLDQEQIPNFILHNFGEQIEDQVIADHFNVARIIAYISDLAKQVNRLNTELIIRLHLNYKKRNNNINQSQIALLKSYFIHYLDYVLQHKRFLDINQTIALAQLLNHYKLSIELPNNIQHQLELTIAMYWESIILEVNDNNFSQIAPFINLLKQFRILKINLKYTLLQDNFYKYNFQIREKYSNHHLLKLLDQLAQDLKYAQNLLVK